MLIIKNFSILVFGPLNVNTKQRLFNGWVRCSRLTNKPKISLRFRTYHYLTIVRYSLYLFLRNYQLNLIQLKLLSAPGQVRSHQHDKIVFSTTSKDTYRFLILTSNHLLCLLQGAMQFKHGKASVVGLAEHSTPSSLHSSNHRHSGKSYFSEKTDCFEKKLVLHKYLFILNYSCVKT